MIDVVSPCRIPPKNRKDKLVMLYKLMLKMRLSRLSSVMIYLDVGLHIFPLCFNQEGCVYTFPVHDSFAILCFKHVQVQDFSNQTKWR